MTQKIHHSRDFWALCIDDDFTDGKNVSERTIDKISMFFFQ